ncbi:MAG: Crp/Fnr family transcriptional regulator [Methylococcaceae bacterium]|nr:Crp/Fnr family transcriptional regulator [Methylococcaceae bacterium]
MTSPQPVHITNCLLDRLPPLDCQLLLENSEHIELIFDDVLYQAGELIPHVYFPTGSFVSLLTPINGSSNLEVGLVGNEGMLGVTLLLDVDIAPFHALVQGAGTALRIPTTLFVSILKQSSVLQYLLKRYLYVSMKQLAQTAGCTRFHVVEERLARWLLMTQDRAHSTSFHVTHVFLAYILGVRRVGVTKAANSLQKQKLIRYRRGDVTILDRCGLEAASCGCYVADKETYDSFMV